MIFNAPKTASYALLNRIDGRVYYFASYSAAFDLKMEFMTQYRLAGNKRILSSPHYHLHIYEL